MKLIVAGSRGYHNRSRVWAELDARKHSIKEIVTGMALDWLWDSDPLIGGPDRYGYEWAKANGVPIQPFRPNWSLGKSAGMHRNSAMAFYGTAALIFWDGESRGTADMMKQMDRRKKLYIMFQDNPQLDGLFE
jgi:hypothetical protein